MDQLISELNREKEGMDNCGQCTQPRNIVTGIALFTCLACALAPMAQAQGSHCLSDANVGRRLLLSVRSALRSPSVPADAAAKADSLLLVSNDSVCTVAVSAFNANAVDSVAAVYLVEVPGDSYVVMPEAVNGKLQDYTWFTIGWTDPMVMTS